MNAAGNVVLSGPSAFFGGAGAVPGELREPSCLKAQCLDGRETHRQVPMAARAAWKSLQWTTKVGFPTWWECIW